MPILKEGRHGVKALPLAAGNLRFPRAAPSRPGAGETIPRVPCYPIVFTKPGRGRRISEGLALRLPVAVTAALEVGDKQIFG